MRDGKAALVILFAVVCGGAAQADLLARGAELYRHQCALCHKPTVSYIAPVLSGLIGREAGSEDFEYSAAFRQVEFVWTPEILDAYLHYPRQMVPGNGMVFYGLDDAAARAAIVAYVVSLGTSE
ncbi:MAG: c-type cytochrome [Pseudomonadota bacterium]